MEKNDVSSRDESANTDKISSRDEIFNPLQVIVICFLH